MKKQIFILVFLVLAAFANVNKSYGQCVAGHLTPVSGVNYDYEVGVTGAGFDGAGTYKWYVTTNVNILNATHIDNSASSATGEIVASGDGAYDEDKTGATSNKLTVLWTSQAIANNIPYYLVVKYSQVNSISGACTAENIKVWEVKPINKFLLAINNFSAGVGASGIFCAGNVTGATVTPSTSTTAASIAYTYGTSKLYAEITASNFGGVWTPSFKITGLDAAQSIASVKWTTDPTGTFTNTTTTSVATEYTATSNATAAFDGSLKIYVEVEVNNNTYEGLSDKTVNIAVDGVIPVETGTALGDVIAEDDCGAEVAFGKAADFTLKSRPTVSETTPATPSFIQL